MSYTKDSASTENLSVSKSYSIPSSLPYRRAVVNRSGVARCGCFYYRGCRESRGVARQWGATRFFGRAERLDRASGATRPTARATPRGPSEDGLLARLPRLHASVGRRAAITDRDAQNHEPAAGPKFDAAKLKAFSGAFRTGVLHGEVSKEGRCSAAPQRGEALRGASSGRGFDATGQDLVNNERCISLFKEALRGPRLERAMDRFLAIKCYSRALNTLPRWFSFF